jgi:hypothetical protein
MMVLAVGEDALPYCPNLAFGPAFYGSASEHRFKSRGRCSFKCPNSRSASEKGLNRFIVVTTYDSLKAVSTFGGYFMLRISVSIFVVQALIMGTSTIVAAQSKTPLATCYNAEKCNANCFNSGWKRNCNKVCDHQRWKLPACK